MTIIELIKNHKIITTILILIIIAAIVVPTVLLTMKKGGKKDGKQEQVPITTISSEEADLRRQAEQVKNATLGFTKPEATTKFDYYYGFGV